MSYILDALRRADAERRRGQVPGLDAPAGMPQPEPPRRNGGPWIVGGLLVALIAAAAWWLWVTGPAAVKAPWPGPAAALGTPPPPAPAPLPAPAPAPASAVAPPPSLPQVVSAPAAVAPATAAAPAPAPATAAARPAAAPASSAEPRALALAELTPDQRREWPPMAVGGSIWSEAAANRFVIVNGQLVHEGEPAAPGVTLERIGPKSMLLRWRGLRVEVPL
jgi:general secretion pathway protein B